jgi:Glyoxalase-like domain
LERSHASRAAGPFDARHGWQLLTDPASGQFGPVAAKVAAFLSLGAKVLQPAEDADSDDSFQVYADPAGHPFCLCWVQRREPR